jgi:hypothetical protein
MICHPLSIAGMLHGSSCAHTVHQLWKSASATIHQVSASSRSVLVSAHRSNQGISSEDLMSNLSSWCILPVGVAAARNSPRKDRLHGP